MRKLKLVFNKETGMYNTPVEMTADELKKFNKAIKAYKANKDEAYRFLTEHKTDLDNDELRQARAINAKIEKSAKELAELNIEMDYKNYLI